MKPNLILLHGALGSAAQFENIIPLLDESFATYTLNFSGHGGKPFGNQNISIELFADELESYIKENKILKPLTIFGYSMGGYVALYLASRKPNLIDRITTLATKFDWTIESAAREVAMLNPEKIENKIPAFASHLEKLHQPNDWKLLMTKTAAMLKAIGENPPLNKNTFSKINSKTKLMVGELDKMVSIAETHHAHLNISGSNFKILTSVEHPFEKVDVNILVEEIMF